MLVRFWTFGDIRRQILKSSKIMPNCACFGPYFFGGEAPPESFDRNYKNEHTFDHGAKFRGDGPRRSSEISQIKKNKRQQNISPLRKTSFRVYKLWFHTTAINVLQTPEQLVFLPLLNLGLRVILSKAHVTRDSIGPATWGISVQHAVNNNAFWKSRYTQISSWT